MNKNKQYAETTHIFQYVYLLQRGFSIATISKKVSVPYFSKCRYCTLFHTEMAKMAGATNEEIAEVLRYTGNSVLWSAWLNGNQTDFTEFRDELRRMMQFMKSKAGMPETRLKASI